MLIIFKFNENGSSTKNSPSYIIRKSIISIKLILYCTFIFVKDLKPHS